jgi:hypothetical protein
MAPDQLVDHIPKYLSAADQLKLVEELRDFENRNYYTTKYATEILQGDGWSGFDIVNFNDGRRDQIKGIMLSNSCDLDSTNRRESPSRIVFAPLIKVSSFMERLKSSGALRAEQIQAKFDSIRRQRVTSLFFLPAGGTLGEDHIAVLDDLHNIPLRLFESKTTRSKLFTLSQLGFYLLLLKISIHFCRFSEDLTR